LPKVIQELSDIPRAVPFLSTQINDVLAKLEEIKNCRQDIKWTLQTVFTQSNYDILLKFIWNIKNVWLAMIEFILSLILSYVFIVDRKKIMEYLKEMKKWNFAFLYNEYEIIFTKISNWFWLIFKAQSLISCINTLLTIVWLYFIAFIHWATTFPYIFTLAIIVFIFWMIPVLGMFLSSIPMMMIWFSFWLQFGWGITVIIEVLLMVVIIHIIEAYYLNPRIVSSYAELPISLTFVILVVSEQLFWMAWLLIWVPIFYILIDVLKDFDTYLSKVKKAYVGISYLQKETKASLDKDIRLSRSGKKGAQ
jgi:predicted PurR-regulated permease PerM